MLPSLHHAAVALKRASSVVVCAHVRPDGDAVGSVLALTLALRSVGVPAVPTLADDRDPSETYAWLPGYGLYVPAKDLEAPQVFVALDTPIPERLGVAQSLCEGAETVVVIDHHPDAKEYGDVHVLESSAAATGELVWQLLDALEAPSDPDVALCCYTALLTDTGRFSFQNTTSASLRHAAEMVDAGVDPSMVALHTYQTRSSASLALEARAMSRLTCANGNAVAYTWVEDNDFVETGARPEEAEHLPEAIRVVEGIEVALLLRQRGSEVRGNLRAKTSTDVGSVARHFGGGGHRAASGFTVENSTVEQVLAQILPMLPGWSGA
ncbi:MAG TPA: bifunctional oligoribonuclease/PAP phosphatase NrnA [Coriobacteriia bacterium]|nr:bifunctional oligoribonuclease/PAP phosphatase NrnA [Coriobacteriia bacterium]